MGKYRVGIIGCGRMGQVWVETVGRQSDCRVGLTYDPDPELAAEKAKAAGAQAAETLEQLVESPEIDLVVVCTPTYTHPEIVEQAAQGGKHILCEKPMALTLEGCRRIIDACAAAGVELAIGQTIRFWGAFLKARQLVAEGVIGTPCLAQVLRGGAVGVHKIQKVGGEAAQEPLRWRFDTRYSGGDILEGVVHELDFTRSLLGEARAVYCTATGREEYGELASPRMIQAVVDFENGSQATVRMGGFVGYSGGESWVGGTEGTLVLQAWDGPVRLFRPGGQEPELFPSPSPAAYDLELRDLLTAVESGEEPENSGVNGMRNIGLGLAMYQSIESGKRLDFRNGLPVDVSADYQYRGPSGVK